MQRLLFLLILLASSAAMTRSEPTILSRGQSAGRLEAIPVALDPEGGAIRVGALRYVGGWELRSADPRFGGLSAMTAVPGGFLAISDSGSAMWIERARGRPARLRLRPLPDGPGDGVKKSDRDSEAIATDPAGRIWVTFERHNEVWRYAPGLTRAEARRPPPEMRGWPPNSGAEAMARLGDGRFLIFSEGAGPVARSSDLILFDRDPTDPAARGRRIAYKRPQGFAVTDAVQLDARHILVLHRSASLRDGLSASLGLVAIADLASGVVTPRVLATVRPPMTVDNMEALAIERTATRTRIWIASDDNFSTLLRTLLLGFDLDERMLRPQPRRAARRPPPPS